MQVNNLFYDYVTILLLSIYILGYANPIFGLTMEKVFWQFPQRDIIEQW